MITRYVNQDGFPIFPYIGKTITPDNFTVEFKVKIRSPSEISPNTIKRLLEQSLEVVEIVEGDTVCVVRQ